MKDTRRRADAAALPSQVPNKLISQHAKTSKMSRVVSSSASLHTPSSSAFISVSEPHRRDLCDLCDLLLHSCGINCLPPLPFTVVGMNASIHGAATSALQQPLSLPRSPWWDNSRLTKFPTLLICRLNYDSVAKSKRIREKGIYIETLGKDRERERERGRRHSLFMSSLLLALLKQTFALSSCQAAIPSELYSKL